MLKKSSHYTPPSLGSQKKMVGQETEFDIVTSRMNPGELQEIILDYRSGLNSAQIEILRLNSEIKKLIQDNEQVKKKLLESCELILALTAAYGNS